MKTSDYIFTGFYPSGNPGLWYYDENKKTMFAYSETVTKWEHPPKIGDRVSIISIGKYNEITSEVFINGEQVFKS